MMENRMRSMNEAAEPYDPRKYERIWQRVAPSLSPYPLEKFGGENATASAGREMTGEMLPGAQENPCCMGSAAAEDLEVLVGFIEEELADCRHYTAFAQQVPAVRQTLQCEKTLWLVLEDAAAQEALLLLQQTEPDGMRSVTLRPKLACVSVVGSGIGADTDVLPRMLAAVEHCGQAPVLVSGGELRISVFVERAAAQEVLRAVHAAFFEAG